MPYDYDIKVNDIKENDINPEHKKKLTPKDSMIICHADLPCKRCAVGKMTAECNACMARTGRYLCVDKIQAQEVMDAVDQLTGYETEVGR